MADIKDTKDEEISYGFRITSDKLYLLAIRLCDNVQNHQIARHFV